MILYYVILNEVKNLYKIVRFTQDDKTKQAEFCRVIFLDNAKKYVKMILPRI